MTATNRKGEEFKVGDIVQMMDWPVLYPKMADRPLEIIEIEEDKYASESGFQILVKDLETGNNFKRSLDTNWFQKVKDAVWNHYESKSKKTA
jgi:hypothetical protein